MLLLSLVVIPRWLKNFSTFCTIYRDSPKSIMALKSTIVMLMASKAPAMRLFVLPQFREHKQD